MSQWDLQANETRMNFRNYVNDEVVEAVQKKFMEGYDTIYVAFDVIGRTRHEYLSYQLGSRLRALYGPKVNIEVDYNYQCVIKWVTDSSQVVEEGGIIMKMTENEAIEKLRAYHKCQRLQVKGIYEDCNRKLCDNCDLCYAQGNTGEHIESVKVAINALEKQIPKKLISTGQYVSGCCPNCKKYISDWLEYSKFMCCPYCGQKLDWSEEE